MVGYKDAAGQTAWNFATDKVEGVVRLYAKWAAGVENNGLYNKDVTITFNEATATLDGQAYTSGSKVTSEGDHTLVVSDAAGNATTIQFTIDKTAPVVTGVSDHALYKNDVTVTFNEGTATLNGATITSGTVVSKEGTYTLIVTDKAGNITTVTFMINKTVVPPTPIDTTPPVVTGVSNNGLYNHDVTVSYNEGTATLNGEAITSGIVVSHEGTNTLIVTDQAGNVTTVTFTIDKTAPIEEIGVFKYVAGTQKYAAAGDVNGDGVIDVLDVKQVAKKFGVQKPSPFNIEDLNQDGIVNATDMNYLVGNLYKANPDATITPKEIVDGKYSTDYFNVLGISSIVNTLKATTKTNNTATLNWLAAVDATNVIIEQSTDGVTWTAATTASPVAVDSNTAVVTGLNPNTEYQFRVNVTGGLNIGRSNVVKLTTNATPVTPPVTPKAPIINVIDDNDTTITGTADANVNIAVKNNGAVVATGKANAEGNYSIEISPQKAGTVLTVSATNAAGDQSEATSITVLDRTAPNAPTINVIDDNDTTISGTAEANATIVVKNNDIVVATGKANEQGNYSITIDTQKAGTVLTVIATDAVGNQSLATSITVLDRTAPIAPKINAIDDNDTKISGSTEANATIVVKNNGKTIATGKADSKGAFSIKINHQKAGTVLTVTATDKSGNISAASKIKVLDKTAPNAPKITSFIIVKNKNDIQITGTAEANSTIIVKNGNKVVATVKVSSKGTFTVKLSKVGKGKKNITLLAVDNAGNKSIEVKRSVTIK